MADTFLIYNPYMCYTLSFSPQHSPRFKIVHISIKCCNLHERTFPTASRKVMNPESKTWTQFLVSLSGKEVSWEFPLLQPQMQPHHLLKASKEELAADEMRYNLWKKRESKRQRCLQDRHRHQSEKCWRKKPKELSILVFLIEAVVEDHQTWQGNLSCLASMHELSSSMMTNSPP